WWRRATRQRWGEELRAGSGGGAAGVGAPRGLPRRPPPTTTRRRGQRQVRRLHRDGRLVPGRRASRARRRRGLPRDAARWRGVARPKILLLPRPALRQHFIGAQLRRPRQCHRARRGEHAARRRGRGHVLHRGPRLRQGRQQDRGIGGEFAHHRGLRYDADIPRHSSDGTTRRRALPPVQSPDGLLHLCYEPTGSKPNRRVRT
ncbi:Os01g0843432, partial [Oryza sativa Japonica Group]